MVESKKVLKFQTRDEALTQAKLQVKILALGFCQSEKTTSETYSSQIANYTQRRDQVNQEIQGKLHSKLSTLKHSIKSLSDNELNAKRIGSLVRDIGDQHQGSSGQFSPELSEKVNQLLQGKRNIEKVIDILKDYQNIEDELGELEQKLLQSNEKQDDTELFYVYKKFKTFAYVQKMLQSKIKNSGLDPSRFKQVESKFSKVENLHVKFNEKVRKTILQSDKLAKDDPVGLVRILRIVENEQITNASLKK